MQFVKNHRTLAVLLALFGLIAVVGTTTAQETGHSLPEDEINANPVPIVERLLPNNGLLTRRDYREVVGAGHIYDAPGGNLIASYPTGTFFVSVQRVQDGWAEINDGQWMPLSDLQPAPISRLGGVFLDTPNPYPYGWIRSNIVPSRQPGQEPATGDLAVLRYTLVNVFDQVEIDNMLWGQIGVAQWVPVERIAVVNPIERPDGVDTRLWVAVDLDHQILYAYEDNTPVFAALIATGAESSPTETGLYHVYARYGTRLMSRGSFSDPWFYYLEDVPYAMFFDGDMGIHGAYWHDEFGEPRSHGCINLSLTDAYWVYSFLSEEFDFSDPEDIWPVVYVYTNR
jgi:hypothetical protein